MKIVEQDGVTRNYAYDNLYRLTDEDVKQGTAPDAPTAWRNQFAYDPVGNRLEQLRQTEDATPQPVVYTYDERDRLLTENGISGPVTYGWDANGNQTAKSGTDGATYTWDIENRLVRVELPEGTVVEHTYDVDGARVRTRTTPATGPPTTIDYLTDPWHQTSIRGGLTLSQAVAETDATNSVTAYYVRGDDLLASLRPEVANPANLFAKYFHAEGIGTTRALTDEIGAVTDRYTLEAFGTLLDHVGHDLNAYLFAGEPLDPNSGFYFNRARWLDPNAGRFASLDPFGGAVFEPTSLHRYLYAKQNAVMLRDPTGEDVGAGSLAGLSVALSALALAVLSTIFILATIEFVRRVPIRANHYTRWEYLPSILARGIKNPNPGGLNYFTVDVYVSGAQAKSMLAMRQKPELYINLLLFIRGDRITTSPRVFPANGEPGGGTEMWTDKRILIWGRAPMIVPLLP